MFEGDLSGLTAAEVLASGAEHHAVAREHEVSVLVHAQQFAALHSVESRPRRDRGGESDRLRGRERGVVLGGAGCPEIAEFAPAEFGAVVLGVSAGVAAEFVGQALALLHRLPRCWAMVQAYEATPWKARKIATACLDLSLEAAALVDHEVAGIIDSVTPARLTTIVKAALWKADPEAAAAAARQKQRERGVYVGQSDDNGTKAMYVLAASGDVIRFDATINSIADALKTLGDTDPLRLRRAKAIGILADPDYALALLTAAQEARTAATAPANPAAPADPASPANPATGPATSAAAAASTDPASHRRPDSPATSAARPGAAARPTRPAATNDPADPAAPVNPVGPAESAHSTDPVDDTDLGEWWMLEPDDEIDRDAPHPSSDLPDPFDTPPRRPPPGPGNPTPTTIDDDDDSAEPMDAAARRALNATLNRLDGIAHGTTLPNTTGRGRSGRAGAGTGRTVVYVHLTDQTLATGTGVLRVENLGPLLADQLAELIGHRPYVVKPVIDLNRNISVDAYEIPARIRERIKLTYPVEQFPYGTAHTTNTTDLDHIRPYDPLGPTEQTSTTNLAPLRRFTHRLKTHGRWQVRRLDDGALEWTSPHQFTFRVDHTGTHRTWPAPHLE
ncbi:hypothetical protein EV643_119110 [Kribbella sp. VKM Ac-2527]|uniref:DUF222 domain-containing protein n=1 Tax=Kribbella caucasensis TaxID=2512215 RepID=A0A4R6K2W2_9ACTN|nr:hypothetical protein [Kribbella sp. VKM Ac-2527]TDO43177.1 hypothetical protein EV643_119110 [Kribbella sp. VKM Ac-2527]